jgi:uncharacterized protein YjbJ (UPF0337 family)
MQDRRDSIGEPPSDSPARWPCGRDASTANRKEHGMGGLDDKLEGKGDELKGRVKEAVGDATDNESLQSEGATDKAGGKAKQAVGDVKQAADDLT